MQTTTTNRLTSTQLRFFGDEGYLIVDDVFDRHELNPLRDELSARIDRKLNELHAEGKLENLHADKSFEHRMTHVHRDNPENGVAIVKELQGIAGGGHCGAEMFRVITHPKLLAVVEALVGSPEIVASSVYRIRPKFPGLRAGDIPWHQDSGYFSQQCDRHLILTVWLPLVDATIANGCMSVLPRAHQSGVFTHHTGGNAGLLVIEDEDLGLPPDKAVPVPCPLGGAVFMTNLTPHCSTPNNTDIVRWSIDLRYQSEAVPNNVNVWPTLEDATTDPQVQMACYPPEADFVVRSDKHPERVASYEDFLNRRTHYDRVRGKGYPKRGWTPVGASS